jgi:hypothetical protein
MFKYAFFKPFSGENAWRKSGFEPRHSRHFPPFAVQPVKATKIARRPRQLQCGEPMSAVKDKRNPNCCQLYCQNRPPSVFSYEFGSSIP